MPTEVPFYQDLNVNEYQVKNHRVHNITDELDFGSLKDGLLGYLSAAGNKRLAFWDIEAEDLILVPRLDRAETATVGWVWDVLNPTSAAFRAKAQADAQAAFQIAGDGDLQWGSGAGAFDTNLYRASANVLATDDDFDAADLLIGGISISSIFAPISHTHAASEITAGTFASGDFSFPNNLGIGTTSFGTSAAKVLAIGSGTAPTTSPTDVVQMWSADLDATPGFAALHLRSEDGAISTFGDSWLLTTVGSQADILLTHKLASGDTTNGTPLATIGGYGWQGSARAFAAQILFRATEDFDASGHGGSISFSVVPRNATSGQERFLLEDGFAALFPGTAPSVFSYTDPIYLWVQDRDATAGKGSLVFRAEDNTRHLFGDRVGLGTITPDCMLHVNGAIKTAAPSGGTAAEWKFGSDVTSGTSALDTTGYVELDIGGSLVKLARVTNS